MTGENTRERIQALDVIRGILILCMIVDHIVYDCTAYLNMPYSIFDNPIRHAFHNVGCFLFIGLSGASSSISRSNWKRGLKLAVVAALVTLVTWVLDHDGFIVFGILHCLAACTLLYALAKPALDRIPRSVQPVLWILLTLASFVLTDTVHTTLPGLWILGFPAPGFYSADYFPLLPWIFVYLLGAWAGPDIFGHRLPDWFYRIKCRPLALVGRWSLIVYLAHQPLILGIMLLLSGRLAG